MCWTKTIRIAAHAVLLGNLLALSACTDGARQDAPEGGGPPGGRALPVEAAAVETGAVAREVSTVGTLRANESVMIRSEIAGRVAAVHFKEGDAVTENAPLISLDDAELRAQLAESAATVKLAELNFTRAQEIFDKKLLSKQNYDEALARLNEARARYSLQQARLAKTRIHAPFPGVLGLRRVSVGDYIREGDDIVNLEDVGSLKLDFRVPETYLAGIKQGQQVNVQVDAYPGASFQGKVYAIDPRLDEQTRSVLMRARIANSDLRLRPGMFARVALVLETRTQALLIPEQALWPIGDEQFVFRIVDGKALQTKVQTGQRASGKVEISAGLSAGDVVVTAGQTRLRDGMAVKITSQTGNQAPAAPAGS
jgi:membrane fusion protein (multidrug efflux system)